MVCFVSRSKSSSKKAEANIGSGTRAPFITAIANQTMTSSNASASASDTSPPTRVDRLDSISMVLADCLLPLQRNPMSGVVSPPLLATTGIVPLSIFSTGPDIIGHYYDCIVAARKEVILLTNYWQGGKNVDRIAEALRELNSRVQKRRKLRALEARRKGQSVPTTNPSATPQKEKEAKQQANLLQEQGAPGSHTRTEKDQAKANGDAEIDDIELGPPTAEDRVVVKLMWDRGPQTLADLFRLRKPVPPSMWKTNGLPTEQEIPNLTMEILNYHRPLMGTFHAKLLIVDRQVALINSNNIQDRPTSRHVSVSRAILSTRSTTMRSSAGAIDCNPRFPASPLLLP